MVLYVTKWNLRTGKEEAYAKWAKSAVQRGMAVKGLVEFRGYRSAVGSQHAIIITQEFADMAAWASWQSNEETPKIRNELDTFVTDVTTELWGPSPLIPAPVRPGK